ncbi:hypothetical protein GGX14DRAFT_394399 [Mycena pura]|uniref:Uncharacterized protein n=1 Tax=Mycena pura TaxID=153505 RepID=A0AAD6VEN7_9AGAR|nr:hypothetical protein GGX14DRAFT_394399 [Mycena pura]
MGATPRRPYVFPAQHANQPPASCRHVTRAKPATSTEACHPSPVARRPPSSLPAATHSTPVPPPAAGPHLCCHPTVLPKRQAAGWRREMGGGQGGGRRAGRRAAGGGRRAAGGGRRAAGGGWRVATRNDTCCDKLNDCL